MKTRPVMIATINGTSTPAKRALFRIALAIAMVGAIAVSTILILQGGLALGHLRYFVDVGQHPLHVTSVLLLVLGILSLLAFIVLTLGIIKVNKTFAMIAAALLAICSLGLIALSIWSFLTITSSHLSTSINDAIVKELDQTQYSVSSGNNLIIDNTYKMARLEKQYRCCGLKEPIEDYRSRQPNSLASLNLPSPSSGGSGNIRGRTSTQRGTTGSASSVQLPISCCNEKYRSADNTCIDMFGNNTNAINRYNSDGCHEAVFHNKFKRIERQGFITIVAACLAVISCIALAAVIKLLGEGYQIIPLRTTT